MIHFFCLFQLGSFFTQFFVIENIAVWGSRPRGPLDLSVIYVANDSFDYERYKILPFLLRAA